MGTRITVVRTGQQFEPLDITQTEDVFNSNIGNTSGGIPMLTITLPPNLNFLEVVGEAVLVDSSTLGKTSGVISEITVDNMGSPACLLNTKLNPLVRMTRAKPFVGTLTDLIKYYFKLGDVTAGYQIDPSFDNIEVHAQGWEDVIWTRLSKLQSVYRFEIALVSDFITVRPWKQREADVGHITSTTYNYSTVPISRSIEIDHYSNHMISNEIVYPVGGIQENSSTITAEARETAEVEIELSASVSSIRAPQFADTVAENYSGPGSIFTVMDKDGFMLTQEEWDRMSGKLTVEIGPDSTTLIVKFVGPNFSPRSPYRVAFAPFEPVIQHDGTVKSEPNTDRQFNSLFIVGSGVGFAKHTVNIQTSAREQDIVEEVGAQISEPEISTLEQLYNAAFPVLNEASGGKLVLSGTVARINQRGQTGVTSGIPVEDVEDLNVGLTYGIMEDDIHAGKTYEQVEDFYNQQLLFEFDNQAFGNSAGARIYDVNTDRWYRITSATISMSEITFEAEDDLTVEDVEDWVGSQTYGYVEDTLWGDLTYWQVELRGLK